jgi:ribosomal protein S18 acetylase RimI-like enzyme
LDKNIIIRKLNIDDCTPELLNKFNRYQEIKKCWRKENNEWTLKDIAFTEDWDSKRKLKVIDEFTECIKDNGLVIGAYVNDDLIGFSFVFNKLFGKNNKYINLDSIQVSYGFRSRGIGKKLFREICAGAKNFGAEKLYISANSSEESQAFYKAMGCREAEEINQELFEEEPFDCHLEYILSPLFM